MKFFHRILQKSEKQDKAFSVTTDNYGEYQMKKQCECCYKRFELIRDTSVPVNPDITSPQEHIYCPWCGAENGTVEKGSLIKTQKCNAECEF